MSLPTKRVIVPTLLSTESIKTIQDATTLQSPQDNCFMGGLTRHEVAQVLQDVNLFKLEANLNKLDKESTQKLIEFLKTTENAVYSKRKY
jgi:hypothetical protein